MHNISPFGRTLKRTDFLHKLRAWISDGICFTEESTSTDTSCHCLPLLSWFGSVSLFMALPPSLPLDPSLVGVAGKFQNERKCLWKSHKGRCHITSTKPQKLQVPSVIGLSRGCLVLKCISDLLWRPITMFELGGAVAKMVKALVKKDLTWIGGAWIETPRRQQKNNCICKKEESGRDRATDWACR